MIEQITTILGLGILLIVLILACIASELNEIKKSLRKLKQL